MLTDDELRAAYDGADQSTAGWHILGLRAVADAVLAKAIPPGFVVVPVEPTKAMLAAGDKIMDCDPLWIARGYRAMLAAAPPAAPPPSAPQPEAHPVAWMVYTQDGQSVYVTDNPADIKPGQRALPLYTSPQPINKGE